MKAASSPRTWSRAALDVKFMVPDGCFEKAFIDGGRRRQPQRPRATSPSAACRREKLKGKGAEFVEKYKEKYNAEPEAYAVYGYEAAKVALEAIETAGKKDRDAIRAGRRLRSRTSTARSATGRSTRTATPRSPP